MEGKDSFTADAFPDLEPKVLPSTISGILLERIDRQFMTVKIAEGDGNCLFRAVCKVLRKKQRHHYLMRTVLVEEMRKNKQIYMHFALEVCPAVSQQPSFNAYLERMSRDGEWGDLICVLAAANLFQVRFNVIRSNGLGFAWEVPPTLKKSKKDVYLSFIYYSQRKSHYNALFPRDEVPPVDPSNPSPSDRPAFLRWYRVVVDNVPSYMTAHNLRGKASMYGRVLDVTLSSKDESNVQTGVVTLADKKSMEKVISNMNGEVWDGLIVTVEEVTVLGSPYDNVPYDHY